MDVQADNWCCGNCKLNEKCNRKDGALACRRIHQNYLDNGYIGNWIKKIKGE